MGAKRRISRKSRKAPTAKEIVDFLFFHLPKKGVSRVRFDKELAEDEFLGGLLKRWRESDEEAPPKPKT